MKAIPFRRMFGVCLAFFALIARQNADTLDIWKWRNPLPNGGPYFHVQYLNGHFFGYVDSLGLVTSTDGTNWSALSVPFNGSISQMAYGNGRYLIAGTPESGSPVIISSPDLQNWTAGNVGAASVLAFGGGVFVAGSEAPSLLSASSNGVDWFQISTEQIHEIAYGNGRFVAAPFTAKVLVSDDGTSWTSITIDTNNLFPSISFANGRFYAAGFHSASVFPPVPVLYLSADGLNWSPVSDPRSDGVVDFHVLFGNGIFLGESLSPDPLLFGSADGTNFAAIPANNFSDTAYSTFGNGLFVNSFLQTSADATNWSASAISPTNSGYSIQDIFTTTNEYVAVTTPLLVSSNGLKFSFVTNTLPVSVSRVKSANGLFHGVGPGGALARSTNGLDWESRNSATANSLYDIEYGNSQWVAVGANGTITTSSTGNAWSLQTSGTSLSLNGIAYGTNLFVVVGDNGTILTSPTGSAWTPQFSDTPEKLDKVVYGNEQFVAVGTHGTILSSTNAIEWFSHSAGVQVDLSGIAFGDGMFCAVGSADFTNVVLTSTDAITWVSRHTPSHHLSFGNGVGIRFLNGTFFLMSENSILQSGPVRPPQLGLSFDDTAPVLTLQATPGLLLRLKSASTLIGPWQDLGLFTMPPNGSLVFPDPSASGELQKFYRTTTP
jgi:hypothetical protein